MQTHDEILNGSRAALNDQDGEVYTNTVLLAYYNIARSELQEIFEENNIPTTNAESAIIEVDAGITSIGFAPDPPIPDTPYLPNDLIEIRELFCSPRGQEVWIPVKKREYLTSDRLAGGTLVQSFGVWAWQEQEIRLLESLQDNDLKLDYIKSLFIALAIDDLADFNTILNTDTFLTYRTAGLASEFIDEDMERANRINGYGVMALQRSLGISIKGKQSIVSRRRPFRAAFKSRGRLI